MGLKQGLPYLEVNAATLSGTTVLATDLSGTTAAFGASEIGATEIAGGAVTSAKVLSGNILAVHISGGQVTSAKQAFVATGSPTVYGNGIQFGTAVSTAGSVMDVVFGTTFKAAPQVVITQHDGVATGVLVTGSLATTGFTFITGGASKSGTWIACGSF